MLVDDGSLVVAAQDGVLDDAVVSRWHHNHLLRAQDHLLVVLPDVGPWPDLHLGHVGVLVQHVHVVVRRDAVDGLALRLSLGRHALREREREREGGGAGRKEMRGRGGVWGQRCARDDCTLECVRRSPTRHSHRRRGDLLRDERCSMQEDKSTQARAHDRPAGRGEHAAAARRARFRQSGAAEYHARTLTEAIFEGNCSRRSRQPLSGEERQGSQQPMP